MKTWKTALALLLVVTMLLACGAMASAEGVSGTATAEAMGLEETVTVALTLEDGVITAVQADTDKEEVTVGRQALTDLPAAMVEANSVKVDGVAGATSTSNAVISAATAAFCADIAFAILGCAVRIFFTFLANFTWNTASAAVHIGFVTVFLPTIAAAGAEFTFAKIGTTVAVLSTGFSCSAFFRAASAAVHIGFVAVFCPILTGLVLDADIAFA